MKNLLLLVTLYFTCMACTANKPVPVNTEAQQVLNLIYKVNDHWQTKHPEHKRAFWDHAVYHTGNMEAYFLTGKAEYLTYSEKWAEQNEWKGAKSDDKSNWRYNYGETDEYVLFGDYQICFQTYADLFTLHRDSNRIARAIEVMEYQMNTNRSDYWWWVDGLYMVMPVMTKMYKLTGNPLYSEKLYEYFSYADNLMYDPDAKLYYRDANFIYPQYQTTNGKKDFWARGDGWAMAALAKVLKDLPENDPHRNVYIERFQKMAEAIAACQHPDGYWTRSLIDHEYVPGPETSGTALFTYGLLWGINNQLLDAKVYAPVAAKAWDYLTNTAVQPDGTVGYVQPIGAKAIPGQVLDANSTSNFGVGAFLLAACEQYRFLTGIQDTKIADYRVIPQPLEVTPIQNTPFLLNDSVIILYPEHNDKMQKNASFLAEYLNKATGKRFKTATKGSEKNAIRLALTTEGKNPESYQVCISANGIKITAPSEAGIFYGIQFLRKSLPVNANANILLPAVEVNDSPRFAYRGALLDVGRYFFTVDEVKTYIDMMALHNMNYFHFHLTEDQGWRIEIKKYPLLTQIGSVRKESPIGHSAIGNGVPHGGFYTQQELKQIVQYAAERNITVIPEIDLPGHMQGALAAYPELGCTGGPYEVRCRWGISDQVLCVGQEKTFQFLKDVLTEVMEIFPAQYIHIGGDECPKKEWKKCPKCQARIQELGLQSDEKHSKEEYLQSYVINRIETFLNEHGRQIIGWDEILEGGLTPNATVMSWRGEKGGLEAARQKHRVIMTPNHYMYLDYYQTENIKNEPVAFGGYVPVEKVYNYEPYSTQLTPEEQPYIIGVQGNLWTEYIPYFPQAQYMVLPRFAALCEVQWTQPDKKNYQDFLKRLPQLAKIYDNENYIYAKHILR